MRNTNLMPALLVLMTGALAGTASVEIAKQAGLGPFRIAQRVSTVSHPAPTARSTTAVRDDLIRVAKGSACSCGNPGARRAPILSRQLTTSSSPARALMKPRAANCDPKVAPGVDDPALNLAEIDPAAAMHSIPMASLFDMDPADPADPVAVVAALPLPVGDPDEAYDVPLMQTSFGGSSFGGASGAFRGEVITSMAANESFGSPLAFPGGPTLQATTQPGGTTSPPAGTDGQVASVPEPASLTLLALGLLGIVLMRRRALHRA